MIRVYIVCRSNKCFKKYQHKKQNLGQNSVRKSVGNHRTVTILCFQLAKWFLRRTVLMHSTNYKSIGILGCHGNLQQYFISINSANGKSHQMRHKSLLRFWRRLFGECGWMYGQCMTSDHYCSFS